MTEEDFKTLPKGTTLYSADSYFLGASNQEKDTVCVTTWTVVGVTEKNFCIESQHGRRERGRIYNYPGLIRSLKMTPMAAVEHLVEVAALEVERAAERLKQKQEALATICRLRDANEVTILKGRGV